MATTLSTRPARPAVLALVSVLLAGWLGLTAPLRAADASIQEDAATVSAVRQAAQEATKVYFPRAEARKSIYGFEPGDALDKAVLQTPLPLYFIEETNALAYQPGQSVVALLQRSSQWLVPVAIGGSNRVMLEVTATGPGQWTGSALGMGPLARKWQNLQGWWPAAQHFTPRLVVCPPVPGYFFCIPQADPPNLTPLSAIPATLIDPHAVPRPALQPAEKSLKAMRDLVRPTQPESQPSTNK